MKKITAAFAVIVMLSSVTARAGVVLEQEETLSNGAAAGTSGPPPRKRTVMVEGNKEKMILDGGRYVIIDLDKGTLTMISSANKTYIESPFPPAGARGMMAKQFVGDSFNYQKTDKKQTVAGYNCVEYTNSSKTPNSVSSTTACYSKDAPGAAEYAAFQKAAALKVSATLGPESAGIPDGIPLLTHTSRKLTGVTMPGLPPDQATKLSQMMANRPPMVSDLKVIKITAETLPADTFSIPEGYTKRDMMRPGLPPGMHPGIAGGMGGGTGGPAIPMPPAGSAGSMVPSAPSSEGSH